jgi:ferredoxin/flavodoxin---NADP+ reductase
MSMYDLAVIGGGPGGLSAAMYGALRGISVVAFEAESFGGQLVNLYPSKPVTNFPAQATILSGDLALRLADQASGFGAELREREPVEQVTKGPDGFVLTSSTGETTASALTLALGLGRFAPRRLGLEGEDRFLGKGLAYRLPPIEQIHARRIVVVGGGDTALDTALSLKEVGHVTLVHRRAEFRAFARSQRLLDDAGIDVITGGEVVELRGEGKLQSVAVELASDETRELPADLLVVSIGQIPDLGGLESWKIGVRGPRIEVDSSMQTARSGLFAVGDFASYPGKVRMIATAVAEGSTAAAAAERYLKAA